MFRRRSGPEDQNFLFEAGLRRGAVRRPGACPEERAKQGKAGQSESFVAKLQSCGISGRDRLRGAHQVSVPSIEGIDSRHGPHFFEKAFKGAQKVVF